MITRYLKEPPFEYINAIVGVLLAAVAVLSVLILISLKFRSLKRKRVERLTAHFSSQLVIEILSFMETGSPSPVVAVPRWYQPTAREVLRDVLLEHLKSMSGAEKDFLADRYDQLGFVARDLRGARSPFWWRRLRSISNLGLLGSDRFAPVFHDLAKDRNELVAAFAHIPLSGLNHRLNRVCNVADLPKAVLKRENVIHEVLKNWSLVHGHDVLLSQIQVVREPYLISALVRAVSTLQIPEVAESFADRLRRKDPLPVDAIEQMLILLRRVGDPKWSGIARKFLEHPQEVVRLRAAEYLLEVGEANATELAYLKFDTSIVVQRAVLGWQKGNAA